MIWIILLLFGLQCVEALASSAKMPNTIVPVHLGGSKQRGYCPVVYNALTMVCSRSCEFVDHSPPMGSEVLREADLLQLVLGKISLKATGFATVLTSISASRPVQATID
ncbi:MAG: hypothetical protein IPN30_03520 [Flavobacteriales bacterium]|nr:hypothetical protein [Flavobacteriales bacterium]